MHYFSDFQFCSGYRAAWYGVLSPHYPKPAGRGKQAALAAGPPTVVDIANFDEDTHVADQTFVEEGLTVAKPVIRKGFDRHARCAGFDAPAYDPAL